MPRKKSSVHAHTAPAVFERLGADQVVLEPVQGEGGVEVLLIKRAVESMSKDREIDNLRRRLDQKFGLDQIVGQSKQMKDVFAKIQRAAPVDPADRVPQRALPLAIGCRHEA